MDTTWVSLGSIALNPPLKTNKYKKLLLVMNKIGWTIIAILDVLILLDIVLNGAEVALWLIRLLSQAN